MRATTLFLALGCVTACSTGADKFRSVLPDDRLLIDESAFSDSSLSRSVGEPSDYYEMTHDTVVSTNQSTRDVLDLVNAITAYPPTWSDGGNKVLWGPWDGGDGNYGQLWMQYNSDGSYDWAIETRPTTSSEDAWAGVLVGHVDEGATQDASSGYWALDLTVVDAAGEGDGTTGKIACKYDLGPDGAKVDVGFGDITDDGSVPADGRYHYETTHGHGGLMDLVVNGDISDPPNGTAELLLIRSRWTQDGQGRADAHVTGGDLGALTYTESECWDRAHETVYLENNFELFTDGDEASCAFSTPSYSPGA